MNFKFASTWAVAALVMAGCGGEVGDFGGQRPAAVSPNAGQDEAELRSGISQSVAPPDTLSVTLSAQAPSAVGPGGVFAGSLLSQPRATTDAVHAITAQLLTTAHGLIQSSPRTPVRSAVHVFGPATQDGVTYRLTVLHQDPTTSWKLEAKPGAADDSAYVSVLTGSVERGPAPLEAKGRVGIDLDAWRKVEPLQKGQGRILAAFAREATGKRVCVKLERFSPDASLVPLMDSDVACSRQLPGGDTKARMTFHQDAGAGMAAKDTSTRIRWLPRVGGRADFAISGGEVPGGGSMKASLCWDLQDREVYRKVELCLGGTCNAMATVGSADACRPELQLEDPATLNEPACAVGGPAGGVQAPAQLPSGPSGEIN